MPEIRDLLNTYDKRWHEANGESKGIQDILESLAFGGIFACLLTQQSERKGLSKVPKN